MAIYRFGYDFDVVEFDSETGELLRSGRRVRLRPQPAKVLQHLLEHDGELVSRGELQRNLWPEGTFVHFDYGLNSCLKQIRKALGDRGTRPGYVETLVKRGVRFVAPVIRGDTRQATSRGLAMSAIHARADRPATLQGER